jgi:hypothetical protein
MTQQTLDADTLLKRATPITAERSASPSLASAARARDRAEGGPRNGTTGG